MESQAEVAAPQVVDVATAGDMIAAKMEAVSESVEEKKETPKEEPETSEIVSEESPEASQPETDEAESGETEEISEDSEIEAKDTDTKEPEAEPTETYESIADLAEATGMELETFLDTVKQTVKINGEEMEVSLKDLTAGYQMESDYRRKTTELSEQRRSFESEKEQAASQIQNKFREAEAISATLESDLMAEYSGVNWNQLEANDPAEWAVQRQKFGERAQKVESMKATIQAELTQRDEQVKAQEQEQYQNHLRNENESLLQAIPEWSNDEVRSAEVIEMTSYLGEYGFSAEEANQISDHRIMRLIRDSYKRANTSQKIDVVKKKVRTLPKIVKPSAKTNTKAAKQRNNANTWSKYIKSGTQADLTAHLASKL